MQAQERPRFSSRGGFVKTYDPPKSREYKKLVAYQTKQQIRQPFDKPCRVKITVYREVPKSWSKTKKADALEGKIHPKTTPDLDNYIKSILDGMNKIAFVDDNLVCEIVAKKKYGEPRAEIEITEMSGK